MYCKVKTIEIQNEKIYEFDSYENACKYLESIQPENKNNNKGESTNNQK